jgi:hypothetical protein
MEGVYAGVTKLVGSNRIENIVNEANALLLNEGGVYKKKRVSLKICTAAYMLGIKIDLLFHVNNLNCGIIPCKCFLLHSN